MNLKNIRIVIDEREKKSGIPGLLKGIGINLEIKTLPIGDYIVAPETIVERKTISDLVSSVFDGRLFDQCNRLKEHYKFPILLIEGNIDEIEDKVIRESLQGMILSRSGRKMFRKYSESNKTNVSVLVSTIVLISVLIRLV